MRYRTESVNANEIANGVLSALVSITAGCPFVDYWGACLIGGTVVIMCVVILLTHKQCQECVSETISLNILQHLVWYSIMLAVGWSTSLVSRTRLEWCQYTLSGRSGP